MFWNPKSVLVCDAMFLLQVNAVFTVNKNKTIDIPTLYSNNKIVIIDSVHCTCHWLPNWKILVLFFQLCGGLKKNKPKISLPIKPLASVLSACKCQCDGWCALSRVFCSSEEMTGVNVLVFSKPILQLSRLDNSELTFWVVVQNYS